MSEERNPTSGSLFLPSPMQKRLSDRRSSKQPHGLPSPILIPSPGSGGQNFTRRHDHNNLSFEDIDLNSSRRSRDNSDCYDIPSSPQSPGRRSVALSSSQQMITSPRTPRTEGGGGGSFRRRSSLHGTQSGGGEAFLRSLELVASFDSPKTENSSFAQNALSALPPPVVVRRIKGQSWCHLRLLGALRRAKGRLFERGALPSHSGMKLGVTHFISAPEFQAAHPWLKYFPLECIQESMRSMKLRAFLPGEVIYYRGTRNDTSCFIIVSGAAEVQHPASGWGPTAATQCNEAEPNQKFIGINEMLTSDSRRCTVTASRGTNGCFAFEMTQYHCYAPFIHDLHHHQCGFEDDVVNHPTETRALASLFTVTSASGLRSSMPVLQSFPNSMLYQLLSAIKNERLPSLKRTVFRKELEPHYVAKTSKLLKAWMSGSGLSKLLLHSKPIVEIFTGVLLDLTSKSFDELVEMTTFISSETTTTKVPTSFYLLSGTVRVSIKLESLRLLCGGGAARDGGAARASTSVLSLVLDSLLGDLCMPLTADRPRKAPLDSLLQVCDIYFNQEPGGLPLQFSGDELCDFADLIAPCLINFIPSTLGDAVPPVRLTVVTPLVCCVSIDPRDVLETALPREDRSLVRKVCLQVRAAQMRTPSDGFVLSAVFPRRILKEFDFLQIPSPVNGIIISPLLRNAFLIELGRLDPLVLDVGDLVFFARKDGHPQTCLLITSGVVSGTDGSFDDQLPGSQEVDFTRGMMWPRLPTAFFGTSRDCVCKAVTRCTAFTFGRASLLKSIVSQLQTKQELNAMMDAVLLHHRKLTNTATAASFINPSFASSSSTECAPLLPFFACGDRVVDEMLSDGDRVRATRHHQVRKQQQQQSPPQRLSSLPTPRGVSSPISSPNPSSLGSNLSTRMDVVLPPAIASGSRRGQPDSPPQDDMLHGSHKSGGSFRSSLGSNSPILPRLS